MIQNWGRYVKKHIYGEGISDVMDQGFWEKQRKNLLKKQQQEQQRKQPKKPVIMLERKLVVK